MTSANLWGVGWSASQDNVRPREEVVAWLPAVAVAGQPVVATGVATRSEQNGDWQTHSGVKRVGPVEPAAGLRPAPSVLLQLAAGEVARPWPARGSLPPWRPAR